MNQTLQSTDQSTKVYMNIENMNTLRHPLVKSFQNKKGLKIFQVHCFRCFFYSWQLRKRHRKRCTWNFFWPFLFFDGFRRLVFLALNFKFTALVSFEDSNSPAFVKNLPYITDNIFFSIRTCKRYY